MPTAARNDILTRHARNPLLTCADWPYTISTVFNAGAVRLPAGCGSSSAEAATLLLCRVEDRAGISHLCAARSPDGIGDWTVDDTPTLPPDPANHPEEEWGIEDPRVVWHEELERFSVAYCCYSKRGPAVSLALTADFKSFERLGVVLPPENKDAALFPRRFGGRWAMIHRPVPFSVAGAEMWISFSPDLKHWGDHQLLMSTRSGPWWDGSKIGLSTPPIETKEGWLLTYHGARQTVAGQNYYVGLALLDLDDPTRCIRRSHHYVLAPETDYERNGDVDNVVFPCGYTVGDDGDALNLYYGAADTAIALAQGSIRGLLEWLKDDDCLESAANR